jgi:stress-induced-phosphoprotein 1
MCRAYARIGNAYHKEGNLDEALKWLQKSLTEHRTKDVLDKVTRLEKELKEAREQAYVDPALAAEEKAKGNDLFKAGDFPGAVKVRMLPNTCAWRALHCPHQHGA